MSDTYQASDRRPVCARLDPEAYEAAKAVARAEHRSLGAYVALVVEADLRARQDGSRNEAA